MAQRRKSGFKSGIAYSSQSLGEVSLALGDLPGARKAFEEAIAIRRELGQRGNIAIAGVDLAELSLEEGNPVRAETLARDSIKEFAAQKEPELEATARAVLTRALLAQHKLADAKAIIVRAQALLPANAAYPSRFAVKLAMARVDAALGDTSLGKKASREVQSQATQYGFAGYELEARLNLGEIEMRSNTGAGTKQLQELENDARRKRFLLIAKKAHVALTAI